MVDAEATVWLRGRFEPTREYWLLLEAAGGDASPAAPKRVRVEVNGVEVGDVISTEPAPRVRDPPVPGSRERPRCRRTP